NSILSATLTPPPPRTPLFPYTTLFRSRAWQSGAQETPEGRAGMNEHDDHDLGDRFHALRRDDAAIAPAFRAMLAAARAHGARKRSEEHTSELQSLAYLVCRLLLEKKKE